MSAGRVYYVGPKDGSTGRLVRATHPAHAREHIVQAMLAELEIRIATQADMERVMGDGGRVEESQRQHDLPT